MRLRLSSAPILLALLTLPVASHAQGDFNPGGRRSKPPPRATGGVPRPRTTKPPTGKKKPDVGKLIKRYTAIVMKRPHEAFPLQKLTELYRTRDGKLDKLVEEFEKRAATKGSDQFNARLAFAGIYLHAHRKADAAQLLQEAIKDKPKLATPRLMLARLAEKASDAKTARAHYEAALPMMKKGAEKEQITRKLMLLCVELKDFDAARAFHKQLVRASSGSLFVKKELGTELLSRGHY